MSTLTVETAGSRAKLEHNKLASEIDKIVKAQVMDGVSTHEVREDIIARLVEQDIDEKIAEGRKAIKEGRYTVVNKKTTEEFIQRMAKKMALLNKG